MSKKLTKEIINKRLEDMDSEISLVGEYIDIKTKTLFKCHCGNEWLCVPDLIIRGNTTSCGTCDFYSFEQWCLDNGRHKLLLRWDYELNDRSPSMVSYGSEYKPYFKCPESKHESEKNSMLCNLTNKWYSNDVYCKACNSIGQHLIDRDGNLNAWSSKNKVDPFTVAKQSNKKYWIKCLDCGEDNFIKMSDYIRQGIACACKGGISYPEMFIRSVLNQLKANYTHQLTKKNMKWINERKYDFYLNDYDMIIETHGKQHYEESSRGRSLEEEQENDRLKEELARQYVSSYIVIDCRYSTLEWCKENTVKMLSEYLDLSKVDWIQVGKDAEKSIVKEVCDYWNNKMEHETTRDLSEVFKLHRDTIRKYLKRGSELDWCNYDSNTELIKRSVRVGKNNGMKVEVLKDDVSLGCFYSSTLSKISMDIFGVKFIQSSISLVCNGKQTHHKGFVFRYVKD